MTKETLIVANIKCDGCANSISTKLHSIDGVSDVLVDVDHGSIDITYDTPKTREQIVHKLSNMGYPEATAENGLLMKAKSYANCMIGKATK